MSGSPISKNNVRIIATRSNKDRLVSIDPRGPSPATLLEPNPLPHQEYIAFMSEIRALNYSPVAIEQLNAYADWIEKGDLKNDARVYRSIAKMLKAFHHLGLWMRFQEPIRVYVAFRRRMTT